MNIGGLCVAHCFYCIRDRQPAVSFVYLFLHADREEWEEHYIDADWASADEDL